MAKEYSRYTQYKNNGNVDLVPFVAIPELSTDRYEYYEKGKTRLDVLSYMYYENPNYGWVILQANPQYGSLEFNIPDGVRLRIPYPIETALLQYEDAIKKYRKINGENK